VRINVSLPSSGGLGGYGRKRLKVVGDGNFPSYIRHILFALIVACGTLFSWDLDAMLLHITAAYIHTYIHTYIHA